MKLDIVSIHVSTDIIYSQTKCTSVFANRIVSVAPFWSRPFRVVWFFIISFFSSTSHKEYHVWINNKQYQGFSKYWVLRLPLLLLFAPGISYQLASTTSVLYWYGTSDLYFPKFYENVNFFHCTLDFIHGSFPMVGLIVVLI